MTKNSSTRTARIRDEDWEKIVDTGLNFSSWVHQVVAGRDNYELKRIREIASKLNVPLDILINDFCDMFDEGRMTYYKGLKYIEVDLDELKEECERQGMDLQEGIDMCVELMKDV